MILQLDLLYLFQPYYHTYYTICSTVCLLRFLRFVVSRIPELVSFIYGSRLVKLRVFCVLLRF